MSYDLVRVLPYRSHKLSTGVASRSKRRLDDACAFRETRVIGGTREGTGPFG